MNQWLETLSHSDYGSALVGLESTLFVILLSFSMGQLIGFIYMWTHEGVSYSRNFVASLAVLPVLVAIMMVTMSGSLVVAFGLLAVFGVVRFRNVLKDTRDTSFLLWAILEGLSVGTMRYSTALVAALGTAAVFLYLRLTSFGTRNRYDAVLTLRLAGDLPDRGAVLRRILDLHATRLELSSQRRATDEGTDVTYRLLLRDPARSEELQAALAATEGFENVSVFMHDDEAEI